MKHEKKTIIVDAVTLNKLRAYASTMGCSVDDAAERLILEALPSTDHEDLIGRAPAPESAVSL